MMVAIRVVKANTNFHKVFLRYRRLRAGYPNHTTPPRIPLVGAAHIFNPNQEDPTTSVEGELWDR